MADEGKQAWGDDITEERKAELEARLQEWKSSAWSALRGPFDGEILSGADVHWLVVRTLVGSDDAKMGALAKEELRRAKDDIALRFSLRVGALCLDGAKLKEARLEGAHLHSIKLVSAELGKAQLQHAFLLLSDLRHADLSEAHLEGAFLYGAQLNGASLIRARLEGADIYNVHLEGAYLSEAVLDSNTNLASVNLDDRPPAFFSAVAQRVLHRRLYGAVSLADVRWNGAPITAVDWSTLRRLGDERGHGSEWWWPKRDDVKVGEAIDSQGVQEESERGYNEEPDRFTRRPTRQKGVQIHNRAPSWILSTLSHMSVAASNWWWKSLREAETATRANIQVAKLLRDQGINAEADRFSYRAQVRQRGVHLLRFRFGRWLFSWLLFIIAGYGYRPLRTLFWYLAVIGSFAFAYFQATHGVLTFGLPRSQVQPLAWYEALGQHWGCTPPFGWLHCLWGPSKWIGGFTRNAYATVIQ